MAPTTRAQAKAGSEKTAPSKETTTSSPNASKSGGEVKKAAAKKRVTKRPLGRNQHLHALDRIIQSNIASKLSGYSPTYPGYRLHKGPAYLGGSKTSSPTFPKRPHKGDDKGRKAPAARLSKRESHIAKQAGYQERIGTKASSSLRVLSVSGTYTMVCICVL